MNSPPKPLPLLLRGAEESFEGRSARDAQVSSRRDLRVPFYARAILDALRFSSHPLSLGQLSEPQWKKALAFCDRTQLTLPLALKRSEHLPDWVNTRLEANLTANAERWSRLKSTYTECAAAFEAAGLDFIVLKGFSQCPLFVEEPVCRVQYDLDLFFRWEHVLAAQDIALSLGYESLEGYDRSPIDHLPAMIRKTGWEWCGDYFDIDIPVSLELHFQFWSDQVERFGPEGLEEFWKRRCTRQLDGLQFTALHAVDALGYSCLHILRHLLRGGLRLSHVYELAWFLNHKCGDEPFWREWHELHSESLRRLESIAFALAHRWFDCVLPAAVRESIECLPPDVKRWLEIYGDSPLVGLFRPNKDDVWLHWSLVGSLGQRITVLRRRLLPERLPGHVAAVHLPEGEWTWQIRLRQSWLYLCFVISRTAYHLLALVPTAWGAARWFGGRIKQRNRRREFVRFL